MIFLTAACASNDDGASFAETVGAQGAADSVLAERWADGKELQDEGEKLSREADKMTRTAQSDVREGQNLIASGQATVETQQVNYESAVEGLGLAVTPGQLKREIDALQSIHKKWKEGADKITRGDKLIEDGQARLAEGRTKSRRAESLIEKGTRQMRAAEAQYEPRQTATPSGIED
ncbi:hypothetical protein [Hyphococcus sp.]|uniref:hypothetical protein n=1 Tax=Hyphococcus sp. TaxID=2038636 RepID=UPI003CCBC1DE